ncbi:MAG: ribosome small subunit-dependent GTPase A [Opitutaceae bacterium]|nr:ribosome small subunit-dependent GTPase A [Cephaloticoccus sp.]MCP5529008.1 ribosome small subunit-dependent GTPase A [Opitutaceae bacterium]
MTLDSLGWNAAFAATFPITSDLQPARVVCAHKHACDVLTPAGLFTAECTGRLLHKAATAADLPVVGDWVALRLRPGEMRGDIHAVLPRRTRFSRRAAGTRSEEQVVAANLDTVFLVSALDQNYNLRRIERYLLLAWESGADPVVVLNKADLHPDSAAACEEVAAIAPGVPVVGLSALDATGLAALTPWLQPGRTVALLGSSGVGKSTLTNRLLGAEVQLTSNISNANYKGRHTTTRRELLVAPSGALIIDTPGMREIQFWQSDADAVDETFADIEQLAADCRFHDCQHHGEPGCAIAAALEAGELDDGRWQSYQKLQREQAHAARNADAVLDRAARQSWKKISQQARKHIRQKHAGYDTRD